jgi:hypothetical protein
MDNTVNGQGSEDDENRAAHGVAFIRQHPTSSHVKYDTTTFTTTWKCLTFSLRLKGFIPAATYAACTFVPLRTSNDLDASTNRISTTMKLND